MPPAAVTEPVVELVLAVVAPALTAPPMVAEPPAKILFTMPMPPSEIIAPVVVEVASVEFQEVTVPPTFTFF